MDLSVRENTATPGTAKSVQLVCPLCSTHCEAVFPWGATDLEKMKIRHDVIEEHRRVCVGGPAEVGRVYDIEYPRA